MQSQYQSIVPCGYHYCYNEHMESVEQPSRRARTFRLEAIVLRHSDWGEADRLIALFSRQMGKLRAIAKGARRARSRKAGHLEPFTYVSLLLAKGRDIPIITQADTVEAFLPLKNDLLLTTYAAYTVELLDRFTIEGEENVALFRLIKDTLMRLAHAEPPSVVLRFYELRLLDLAGFRPQLFQCVRCHAEIQAQDQFFSFAEGGVLCPSCGQKTNAARHISTQALKYLRHFQRSDYAEARRAKLSGEVNAEMETLLFNYFNFLLERRLNTPAFIQHIRQVSSESIQEKEIK